MKPLFAIAALALLPALADADPPVYRCQQNGRTIFTDGPVNTSCQLIQLQVYQPDPAEVARIEEQKRLAAEQDRLNQQQAEKDRLLQAETRAAVAEARAADARRQLTYQLSDDESMRSALDGGYGYGYEVWTAYRYPGYGYGYGYGYGPVIGTPLPAPYPGGYNRPGWPNPGLPGPAPRGVDRVGPAGRR